MITQGSTTACFFCISEILAKLFDIFIILLKKIKALIIFFHPASNEKYNKCFQTSKEKMDSSKVELTELLSLPGKMFFRLNRNKNRT